MRSRNFLDRHTPGADGLELRAGIVGKHQITECRSTRAEVRERMPLLASEWEASVRGERLQPARGRGSFYRVIVDAAEGV